MIVEMQKISKISGVLLTKNFHWPSDGQQIWRHLSDYALTDKKGKVVEDMLVEEGHYKARGTLLARPGSNYPSMEDIEIEFTTYAIDFGKSLDDAARGYWVRGDRDVWYKMEKPHPDYSVYSDQMEYKVDKFLALHDTLTKGNYEFVTTSPYTQRVSCKLSISDFHKRTDRSFDFAFVEANCEFVLDHLKNNIDAMKSLNFLESIVTLGEIARKDFYILFPEIEKHYKRIENENKRIENERRKENDIARKAEFAEELSLSTAASKGKKMGRGYTDDHTELDSLKRSKLINGKSFQASLPLKLDDHTGQSYYSDDRSVKQKAQGKKSSIIAGIEDFTIFQIKNVQVLKEISNPRSAVKVKWADGVPGGKLFERRIFDADGDLIFNINTTSITLNGIIKLL